MQRSGRLWILGIACVGASLLLYGQGTGQPPAQIPSPGQQSVGPHRTMEALGELRALTAQLNLTPEQTERESAPSCNRRGRAVEGDSPR
jgi:hypothetical protein